MALDASAAGGHGRTSGGHCGGTRVRPRRFPPPQPIHMGPQGFPIAAVPNQQNLPGSLARMAQAAAIGGGIRPVDNNGAFIGPGGGKLHNEIRLFFIMNTSTSITMTQMETEHLRRRLKKRLRNTNYRHS